MIPDDGVSRPALRGTRGRHDSIYRVIRERISLLDYAPGQKLSEEALADEFGVSRTPLRRVLARLESEGLLRSVQSVGTIVTDIDIETLAQTYLLRTELAELIGRLNPVPVTQATLAELSDCHARLEQLERGPDPKTFARINIDFFQALLQLTANEPLREISERLYYRTTRIWIQSLDSGDLADEISIFRREVTDILAAVRIDDLEAVGQIRRAHISMSFKRLEQKTKNVARRGAP